MNQFFFIKFAFTIICTVFKTFMKHNSCNTSSIPLPLILVCRKGELEGVGTLIEGSYSPDLECVEMI